MNSCARLLCGVLFLALPSLLAAQTPPAEVPNDWFLRDPQTDQVQGVSAEKAYATLLKGQPSRPVIVAIIDSGIDIEHEDLKSVIWVNEGEIPNNGMDDDKNGYIDDVHGWNFIGGKEGNVEADTYELTREYIRLNKKFENLSKIPKKQKAEYQSYLKIKDKFHKLKAKNEQEYNQYRNLYINVKLSVDTLKSVLKTDTLTTEAIAAFNPSDPTLIFAKGFVMNILKNVGEEGTLEEMIGQLKEAYDYYKVIVEYGYNENFDSRQIVGDTYSNIYEKNYGKIGRAHV